MAKNKTLQQVSLESQLLFQKFGGVDVSNDTPETGKKVATGAAEMLTPYGDYVSIRNWLEGDRGALSTLSAAMGIAAGPKAAKAAEEVADALAKAIKSQARDAKLWVKQGGKRPPKEVIDQYGASGVLPKDTQTGEPSWRKLQPDARVERKRGPFASKADEMMYDADGNELGMGTDRQMVEYSQDQYNPGATSGLEPPKYPAAGGILEEAGKMGAARTKRWRKGFDKDLFASETQRILDERSLVAAKTKGAKHLGEPPQFWLYDEKAKKIIVVKRLEDGELLIGKPQGRVPTAFVKKKGVVVRDPNGNPVLNPKIDMVVESGGREAIDQMLLNNARAKADFVLPKKEPSTTTGTKWDIDAGDTSMSDPTDLLDQMEAAQWERLSKNEQRDFVHMWDKLLAKDLKEGIDQARLGSTGEAFDPTKWKTQPPESLPPWLRPKLTTKK